MSDAQCAASSSFPLATSSSPNEPANAPQGSTTNNHLLDAPLDVWFETYDRYRVAQGKYSVGGRWRTWISPRIGHMRWKEVTADDVESLRDALDVAIRAWHEHGPGPERISGSTAMCVWWTLMGAARAARRSKNRDLRALLGPNPCADIEPPGDARSRQYRKKTFVYPNEFLALVGCHDVPLVWREVYTVAAYTYLRPGELFALEWSDVDLRHRVIRVSKSVTFRPGEESRLKEPKTYLGIRDIPIHPNLYPLLRRMHAARNRLSPRVLPVLNADVRPRLALDLRSHLRLAGVVRAALHQSTLTTLQCNFRSWRDSGITWSAMAGIKIYTIQRRAGHEDIQTTASYMKIAEDLSGDLGEPFPPLPTDLISGTVMGRPLTGGGRWCRGAGNLAARGKQPTRGPTSRFRESASAGILNRPYEA